MPSSARSAGNVVDGARGEAKYLAIVDLARSHEVLTPEDPWMLWQGKDGQEALIALCLTLYDYSFRPAHVTRDQALDWAMEQDVQATDEALLHADPHDSRDAWCNSLCDRWERKFHDDSATHPDVPFVVVNHWPLREGLVYIPLIPRFSLWCGTKRTDDWHRKRRFGEGYAGASAVVTGHLRVRRMDLIDGCRFEECSLGYPKQWAGARERGKGINDMLREILLGVEETTPSSDAQTIWRRHG